MGTLECSVKAPKSFHPTLQISFPIEPLQDYLNVGCSAKAYVVLPPLAFIDPYELANYEELYTFRHWGPSNLELPTMAMPKENTTVLLDIRIPHEARTIDLQLPIHLRYEELGKYSPTGYHSAWIDCPTGLIACPSTAVSEPRLTISKEAHIPTEVSSLFDAARTTLFPMPLPERTRSISSVSIRVPVGNPSDLAYVEAGTAVTIIGCFVYLLRAFFSTARKMNTGKEGKKEE